MLDKFSEIIENTEDFFEGIFEGSTVTIERESDHFSIDVSNSEISFGTAYDGYWGEGDEPMADAITEALEGSMLV